jgi:PAS domain S-box-containing protein
MYGGEMGSDRRNQAEPRVEATGERVLGRNGSPREVDHAVIATDPAGRITRWNERAETVFGYTRAEVLGRPLAELPLGQPESAIEEALRRSEEWWRALVQHSAEGIVVIDRESKISFVTDSVERMLGYSADDLLGTMSLELVHADDLDRVIACLGDVLRRPRDLISCEYRIRRKDGRWVWFEATFANLLDDPYVNGVVTNYWDIQSRKEAEEQRSALEAQLIQSQKMEAVGMLAGGVAHDFNNLLTIIQNYVQFVAEDLPEDSSSKADLDAVTDAATRAQNLVRQLLAFARRDFSEPIVLSLNSALEDMHDLVRRTLREGVSVELSLAEDLWHARFDPARLEQIVVNLAVNARDAMGGQGKVMIETSNVHVGDEGLTSPDGGNVDPGSYVCLAVSDTGKGMSQATRARIFEPFFSTKPRNKGTGLGLSTVYGIVQQAGGAISCYSEIDLGTTFRIYLPATAAAAAEQRHSDDREKLIGKGETVLLVEDEEALRKIARRLMERSGYAVVETGDPLEAIRLATEKRHDIDLLLTDVVMPEMSGIELAERILRRDATTKVLFMSGYPESVIEEHGLLPEGMKLLQKPFDETVLLKELREVLESPA